MSFVIEFFKRLGIFLVGVPVGMFIAALCLIVGAAFSILGTTLVMVFAAFMALVFVVSPVVKVFGKATPAQAMVDAIKKELNS